MIKKYESLAKLTMGAVVAIIFVMCSGGGGSEEDGAPDDGHPADDGRDRDGGPDVADAPPDDGPGDAVDPGDVQPPAGCSDQGACSHNGTCLETDPPSCDCVGGRYEGVRCEACSVGYGWFEGVCASEEGRRAGTDRGYEWYKTQMGTGRYEANNCGPTSASMSMMWYEESLDVDPGIVREAVTPAQDGWWYSTDIENALNNYGVPYAVKSFTSIESALAELDSGYVLILCLSMGVITRQDPPYVSRFYRFYAYDSGHFLVVKGYMEDGDWLDVYDPNNWTGDYYTDGSPFGKDRFYSGPEVLSSALGWWAYMFVIGASPTRGLDTGTIPVGRSGP